MARGGLRGLHFPTKVQWPVPRAAIPKREVLPTLVEVQLEARPSLVRTTRPQCQIVQNLREASGCGLNQPALFLCPQAQPCQRYTLHILEHIPKLKCLQVKIEVEDLLNLGHQADQELGHQDGQQPGLGHQVDHPPFPNRPPEHRGSASSQSSPMPELILRSKGNLVSLILTSIQFTSPLNTKCTHIYQINF